MYIICYNCGRNWKSETAGSFYQEQAISSQPCPSCESYTLGCRDDLPGPPRRPRRFWVGPPAGRRVAPNHRS